MSKHDDERAARRQHFDAQLAHLETELGFRPPPPQQPRRPLSHQEWLVSEHNPLRHPDPRPALHMARWEHEHKMRWRQLMHEAELKMLRRGHHIALLHAKGEI
jgi:hypothetical protein